MLEVILCFVAFVAWAITGDGTYLVAAGLFAIAANLDFRRK